MALTDTPVTSDTGAGTGTTTQSYTTTHTFSPSAGSMVLVRVGFLFANSGVTSTVTVADNHGNGYTSQAQGENPFDVAGAGIFSFVYGSAPGSTTLTVTSSATSTATGGVEFLISPTIITGQASSPIGPNTLTYSSSGPSSTMSASLVTTQAGSRVYLAGGVGNGSVMTAVSGTTTTASYNGYNNAATGISTTTTGTPGSQTYGWSLSPSSTFGGNMVGVEVLAAGAPLTSTGTAGGGTRGASGAAGVSGAGATFTGRVGGGVLQASGMLTVAYPSGSGVVYGRATGGRLSVSGLLLVDTPGPLVTCYGTVALPPAGVAAALSVGPVPTGPSVGSGGTTGTVNPGFDTVNNPDWFQAGKYLGPKLELEIGGEWTDVSSRVFDTNVSIQRGHPDESTTASPAVFSGTIDNHDGAFSTLNPMSPYYGLLGLNTPIRVSIPDASTHLRLETDTVSYASCPAIGKLNSFEIWIDADADNWYTDQVLAAQWGETGNHRSWILSTLSSGVIQLGISTDGSNQVYPYSFPVPQAHGRISFRITYNATTGQIGFYQGKYCANWVETAINGAATGGPAASTAPVEVGYATDAASRGMPGFQGKIYAFTVLNSLGGTVAGNAVATADFTSLTPGETSWTDAKGNVWALHGTGELSDRVYRFHGEAAAWPQSWTPGDPNARIALSAGGLLRRLGASNSNVQSPMYRAYTRLDNAGLKGYWPFEDGSNATRVSSAIGGSPFRWFGKAPQLAAFSGFTCSAPLVTLNKASLIGTIPGYTVAPNTGAGSDAVVRFLMNVPSGGDANGAIIARIFYSGGAISYADLVYSQGGGLALNAYLPDGTQAFGFGPIAFQVDNELLRVSVELINKGSNTYSFGLVTLQPGGVDGLGYSVTHTGRIGSVSKIVFNQNQLLQSTSIGHVSVETTWTSLFDLGQALNAYQGEVAGVRFERLCTEEGIPFRAVGNIADTIPMGPQSIETLTTLLQECADADQAVWFEPRQVLGWGFRTRASLGNQYATVPFDYNQDQLSGSLEPTIDDQVVKNDITVSTPDGSSSRQVLDDGSARSVGRIGRYDTSFTMNLANDSMLDSQASWLLHTLTVNEPRYPGIETDLANSALGNLYWLILGADMGDRITISNPPAWLPPGLIDQLAQGTNETIGEKALSVQWNGIPSTPYNVAYADDIVFGRADTDGSVLSQAATATATTLHVSTVTSGSPLWTTAPADFPFDISIGGERITVTGITGASSPQTFTVTRSVNGVVKAQGVNADVRLWTPSIISL